MPSKLNSAHLAVALSICLLFVTACDGPRRARGKAPTPDDAQVYTDAGDEDDAGPIEDAAGQGPYSHPLNELERALYDALMQHRADHGLEPIALSYSLTVVARTHVEDLNAHAPSVVNADCNMHSWSDQGSWSSCCYTADHAQSACMWNKPAELTNYPGYGYEISGGGYRSVTELVAGWEGSPGHNDVILNRNKWQDRQWRAVGVGFRDRFAHVWFGHDVDPDTF
ncbi:MAG: hypothetical protein H0U74_11395 [Bradymonadaceae bacterium]|nr:hypothetical protein [Lujinxingiaceae bacterium]